MQYYLRFNNVPTGPMTAAQVLSYGVNANTSVSADGVNWAPLQSFPELNQLYYMRKNGPDANYGSNVDDVSSKKTLCGIMAILFGSLGVQYFILGKVAGGFITILLTAITCGCWSILTFIQGIMMLCMSDSEFKRKYIDSTSTFPLF